MDYNLSRGGFNFGYGNISMNSKDVSLGYKVSDHMILNQDGSFDFCI